MKFIYLLLANSLSKSKTPEIPYVGMVIVWWPITRKISHDTWANELIKAGTHQATCQCKRIAATSHSLCAGEVRKCATICSNKSLDFCNLFFHKFPLHRQRFSQTFCQYTQSTLSLWHVTATCCCKLSPSVFRPGFIIAVCSFVFLCLMNCFITNTEVVVVLMVLWVSQ